MAQYLYKMGQPGFFRSKSPVKAFIAGIAGDLAVEEITGPVRPELAFQFQDGMLAGNPEILLYQGFCICGINLLLASYHLYLIIEAQDVEQGFVLKLP